MNVDRIFNFRFLVPPSLMIFLIFLFSPSGFVHLVNPLRDMQWLGGAIGVIGILSVGFLISSITYFLVKQSLNIINPECAPSYKKIFKLGEFDDKKNIAALELGSWMTLDRIDVIANRNLHVIDQVHKRWNMAMANYNCFFAVLFSIYIITILLLATKLYPL